MKKIVSRLKKEYKLKKEYTCARCGYEAYKMAKLSHCPLCVICKRCRKQVRKCSCIEGE